MARCTFRHILLPALALGLFSGLAAQGRRGPVQTGPVGDFFRYMPNARMGQKHIPTVGQIATTQHQITVNGKTLSYTARVGMMPIKNATTGVIEGYLNYTYYAKNGVTDKAARPITYLFNGGPGSGTLWLHMGAFGPYRINLEPSGMSRPPYTFSPNPDTLLDQTDLCFINAMGTGWSRPTEPKYGKDFWGVNNDIAAFGEFIREFTNQYDLWESPRFLAGESYGTTRAAGLSGYLTDHDMPVTGVFLLSTIINRDATAGDLRYVNALPTQAMTAWYYHKDSPALQKMTAKQVSNAALQFAGGEYLHDLYEGARMTPAEHTKVLQKLHDFIGLPVAYLNQNDLRVNLGQFSTELLRGRHMMTSRLDSRFPGYLENGGAQRTPFDFSEANIENSFLAALEQYMRHNLHYDNPDIYYVLGGGIGRWSGSYSTVVDLEDAFARNPRMHLMVAMGYYDFATIYGAVEWTLAQMKVSPQVRANNIMTAHFQAGHMVYIDSAALAKLRARMRIFYDKALAAWTAK